MSVTSTSPARRMRAFILAMVIVLIAVAAAVVYWPAFAARGRSAWGSSSGDPQTASDHAALFSRSVGGKQDAAEDHADHDHAAHGHADEAGHSHGSEAVLELSPQALRNIGFEPLTLALGDYERRISLPGMVTERPGRTQLLVAAPLGGVVTRVYVLEGEAIAPDAPLFDVRLTHEELVSAQGEFLKTIEELDVVGREIERLETITEGVVAGGRIRDQKYQRQKLEAVQRAQRQALLLHGLSDGDVDDIVQTRQLLQSLTIRAPAHEDQCQCADEHLFHVQKLSVERGEQVDAGAPLAVLADHCELYIQGTAFEDDVELIRRAAAEGADIGADLLVRDRREAAVAGLKILYVADQVDRESRAVHFYVTLPNEIALDRTEGGRRFLQWRFRPGQRIELRVPVETWRDRLVAPVEAVVIDGSEAYVFVREKGTPNHFLRTAVHVEHRDQQSAVLASDGSVRPGDVIAAKGAFQMHLDLKNKAGGGVDPHAGHSH